jgi:chorismate mutase
MTDTPPAAPALEALRRELDVLDEDLLDLLAKRRDVTQQVKSLKQVAAKSPMSPHHGSRKGKGA